MSDLHDLLRQADRLRAPDLWPDIEAWEPRGRGSSLGRRLGIAALALAVAGTGIALAATAFLGEKERRPGRDPAGAGVEPRITAEIAVGQFPQEIAVGEGAVWVTVNDAAPPERWYVARIDPAVNAVTDEIDVFEAHDVAVGAGAVWVTGRDREVGPALFRIDPAQRRVTDTVPLGCEGCHPDQVVASDDAIWLTLSTDYPDSGQVIRVDPRTNNVVNQITVSGDPRDLSIGEGGVWVYSLTDIRKGFGVAGATLYRIDPTTNSLLGALLTDKIPPVAGVSSPPVVAAGQGYVWTSRLIGEGPGEEIVRIDPWSNEIDSLGISDTLFHPFAVEESGVWFRGSQQPNTVLPSTVSRLNLQTMEVDVSVPIDGLALDGALDPNRQTIWLTSYKGPVTRIDLLSN